MPSRDELHTKLDAQCDARRHELESMLATLEEERERGHEWIDSAPDSLLMALIHPGAPSGGTVADRLIKEIGGRAALPKVQLYDPIRHLIRSMDPDRDVTSALVYDALLQTIPELKLEDQRKLKARIAGTLTRLADEKILKVWKSGSGSSPHIYRIKPEGYRSVMDALNEGAKVQS